MKVSVILGHPRKRSFNSAIAATVVDALGGKGHQVFFHDLYEENFGPLLPKNELLRHTELELKIEEHCAELSSAEGIVIVHPNWWGQPPAILKGWVDRVFRPGIAYEFREGDSGEGIPEGLLKAKIALVINTSNTSEQREREVFGDPLEAIWKTCIFEFCGVKNFFRKNFSMVITSTFEERRKWLEEVREIINRLF